MSQSRSQHRLAPIAQELLGVVGIYLRTTPTSYQEDQLEEAMIRMTLARWGAEDVFLAALALAAGAVGEARERLQLPAREVDPADPLESVAIVMADDLLSMPVRTALRLGLYPHELPGCLRSALRDRADTLVGLALEACTVAEYATSELSEVMHPSGEDIPVPSWEVVEDVVGALASRLRIEIPESLRALSDVA